MDRRQTVAKPLPVYCNRRHVTALPGVIHVDGYNTVANKTAI